MKYKKGLLIICLIICLFSIASVCASDVNETVVANENQNDDVISIENEELMSTEDIDEIGATEENELSTTIGNFTDLANDIGKRTDINLNRDYSFDINSDLEYSNGISFSKRITINGNGHYIEGNDAETVFNFGDYGATIKNVIFRNFNNNIIFGGGVTLSFINCTFENNVLPNENSIISVMTLELENCSFINNHGKKIVSTDSVNIKNCHFDSNQAEENLIMYYGESKIHNSLFENNLDNNIVGAGVSNVGEISNCIFLNNTVYENLIGICKKHNGNIIISNNTVSDNFTVTFIEYLSGKVNIFINDIEFEVNVNNYLANISIPSNITNGNQKISLEYNNTKTEFEIQIINRPSIFDEITPLTGTFTDLATEIANANDELDLTRNYTYSSEDFSFKTGIIINKKITINGNGFTIDGNNQAKSFQILNSNVILANISFVNCYATSSGAAIYWSGSNGLLSNCTFINCSIFDYEYTYGGAVYWTGFNGYLSNCSFVNCYNSCFSTDSSLTSSYSSCGGAVYWKGNNGHLLNSTFTNCSTYNYNASLTICNSDGGAIYWYGSNGSLSNCTFVNCSTFNNKYSYGARGGAIYWYGSQGSLFKSKFINCNNSSNGGAVYWYGEKGELFYCSFENCSTYDYTDSLGGAIHWQSNNGSVYNCSFIKCSGFGGAIHWKGSYCSMVNCSFIKCYSNSYGGAISWQKNNGFLSNCIFIDCYGTYGGAVYWSGDNGYLDNCSFINCSNIIKSLLSSSYGGSIYWQGANGNLINCSFVNCSSSSHHFTFGGSVYWKGPNGNLERCSFVNCFSSSFSISSSGSYSSYGGAIYWEESNGFISNCNFVNCSTYNYNASYSFSSSSGGAIYWKGMNGSLFNSSFVSCNCYNENASSIFGSAICWINSNGNLFNCNFINFSGDHVNTIYWSSDNSSISNCSFINCSSSHYGSAIYYQKCVNSPLINCLFINCSCYTTYSIGGIVYYYWTNGYLSNCTFINCFSSGSGGAVCCDSNGTDLFDCKFINCFSNNKGGAVYWASTGIGTSNQQFTMGINGHLFNSQFVNCSANDGGAVYWTGNNGTLFNCSFVNCSSNLNGGAVCWSGINGSLANCSFINCSSHSGGAILWMGNTGNLTNSTFLNCIAKSSAGSIYWASVNGIISNSNFINSSSVIGGGGLYCKGSDNSIINCSFIKCFTQYGGGGADWDSDNGYMYNCYFLNCNANYGGGVYWIGQSGNLINSTFINNTINHNGGSAIHWTGKKGNIITCTFFNNSNYLYGAKLIKRQLNLTCLYSSFEYSNPKEIIALLNNLTKGVPATESISFYFTRDINRTGINCTCFNCNCLNCNCSNDTEANSTDFYYFYVPITGNIASLYEELNNLSIGSWIVDVWYGGDNNYDYAHTNFNINITSSKSTNLVISTVDNYYFNETTGILVKVLSNNTIVDEGFVTIYDNDDLIGTFRVTGKQLINYTPNSVGDHKITIYYDGGIFYKNCENSTNIIVSKANPKINISTSNLTDNGITFYIIVNGNETGNIVLNINNNSYKVNITDGNAVVNVPISYGEYIYTISYSGDKNYNPDIFEYKNQFRYNVDYSISPNIIFAGNTLNFNFNPDTTGKINIKIFNKNYNGNLINGKFIIDGLDVKGGLHNFTLTYEGDSKYNPIFIESQLIVLFNESPFNIVDSELTYGDTIDLTNVLPIGSTGILEILVDDNLIKNISIGNEYKYNALNGGKHYLTLKYSGDEYFKANETTIELNIKKFDSILNINDTIDANPTSNIVVKLNKDATGLITVTIGNKKYSNYLINGTYSFNTDKLTAGINIVNIKYEGNVKYNSFNIDKEINVLLKDPNLIFNINNIISGYNLPIKPTVLSGASGTFRIYVDDVFKTTINVGSSYYLYQQSLGKHEVKIVYSGDSYYKSETSTSIFRVFAKYPIESNDMKIIKNSNKYFQAKFYDEYGEILSNKYVIFNVDGEDYSIRTNSKGIAILNIDLDFGEHNITSINPTANENTTNKLLIFTSVGSEDMYVVNNTDFEFNVTFFDNTAEKLINTPIVFKINGEDKVVTTNSEGVATLKLNLDIGIYNITTINTVTDESKTNKLFVKSSSTGKYTREIDEKDITIPSLPSSPSESITIKLPSDASGTITLSINDNEYNFTVADGVANVKVPELANGGYPYTITYSGDDKYSSFSKTGSLTVNNPSKTTPTNPATPTKPVTKTTLTLKKVTIKRSAKKLTIQATLKVNGKGVKNKIIKFKFNKKTYKARTNAKGVAKIKIAKKVLKKLKKGKKVTYTATYGKITKKVTVKVKK